MPSDYDNNLLRQAILHARVGEYDLAQRYLERAIELADDHETRVQSNYWMSVVIRDPAEKRKYLEETLANEPTHPEARRALALLDGRLQPGELINPDALPGPAAQTQAATTDRFTCPTCGGRMAFAPDGRSLVCDFCSRNQTLAAAAPQQEQDFILSMATRRGHRPPQTVKTVSCQGCGAQFVLPPEQMASACPYCGSNHVVHGTHDLIAPDAIIPMTLDQRQAAQRLVAWAQQRELTPQGKVQAPRGVYAPVWSFDLLGNIPWRGTLQRDRQRVPVNGEKLVSFNEVCVPGAPKLADLLPKIMSGFDTANAPAYDPRYLAGWPAELPTLALADASLEAREQAAQRLRSLLRTEIGPVSDLGYSTAGLAIQTFQLILVPLWLTNFPYDGQEYPVIINGRQGSLHCEIPPRGLLGWINEFIGS
jgi:DNA-directed RNA polymerase subunit RPC12/RpoP